ncbi:MAG: antibiotic biosynthesis monooxygenase [Pseudomonadota bacterium]
MTGVLLELSVKAELVDEFLDMMRQILPETRAYDGCKRFDVWVHNSNRRKVVLNEIWESEEKHAAYLAWRAETGVLGKLVAFLDGPPDPQYFEVLAD